MPLRSYKPTSPGRRFMTRSTFEEITTDTPHKPLLEPRKRRAGRNQQGRMTVRHRGGGAKRAYRRIDFKRDKWDVPARLATIEYDPNRSARIARLHHDQFRSQAAHARIVRAHQFHTRHFERFGGSGHDRHRHGALSAADQTVLCSARWASPRSDRAPEHRHPI